LIKKQFTILTVEIKSVLNSFRTKGSFTRNFSYLLSGRVITTLISFGVTPILTSLYSPEAYGYFAFFNAVGLNFALVSSFGYENALIIVKGEKKFYNLFFFCMFSITVLSFLFGGYFYF
jgi:O-antigen/teichoic acid export membrane protein